MYGSHGKNRGFCVGFFPTDRVARCSPQCRSDRESSVTNISTSCQKSTLSDLAELRSSLSAELSAGEVSTLYHNVFPASASFHFDVSLTQSTLETAS